MTISASGNSKVVQTGTFAASTSLQDLERATVQSLKTIKELTVKDGAGATTPSPGSRSLVLWSGGLVCGGEAVLEDIQSLRGWVEA